MKLLPLAPVLATLVTLALACATGDSTPVADAPTAAPAVEVCAGGSQGVYDAHPPVFDWPVYCPTFLPEGFNLTTANFGPTPGGGLSTVIFEDSDGNSIRIIQGFTNIAPRGSDGLPVPSEREVLLGDVPADLYLTGDWPLVRSRPQAAPWPTLAVFGHEFMDPEALILIAERMRQVGGTLAARGSPAAASTPPPPQGESGGDAVYLSLGDSLQYGCCGDPMRSSGELFRRYLSRRLNRPVEWVVLAGNDTAVEFINGVDGETPQLDRAVATLDEYHRQGRPVVAITISIGGNDLVEFDRACEGRGGPPCPDMFRELLDRYIDQLYLIFTRLHEARDPHTPILQTNYYNASDCGQPRVEISSDELGVRIFNDRITSVSRGDVFDVDIYAPFRGKACEYVEGVDPTYAGHAVIAREYQKVYQSLPPEFVEPFVLARSTP
jgi:hypothetical protein